MADTKKSFILYADLIHTVKKMKPEDAGELFLHILKYINADEPETDNMIVDLTFEPIKQQLKRDLKGWESKRLKRAEAGRKGGLAKASNAKQDLANLAVNVNGTVTVNGNDNVIKKDNITERKLKFTTSLKPFLETYGKEMLNNFYNYWTETNKSGKKMKFEQQKFFEIKKRLVTWNNNNYNSNPKYSKNDQEERNTTITDWINS